ncbi:MAG: hypothetical protein J7K40_13590 [candidate division Zixibacteria bacterium]|nr:hypothetical protein [candidate division Zixibacteria bacterium]
MILRIVLIITIVFLVIWAIQKVLLGFIRTKLLSRVEKRFIGQRIIISDLGASFFGQESKGLKQIRGNGALILTEMELWFGLAMPERELVIPTANIKSVRLTRRHLGKTVFRPLLCVDISSRSGEDTIAWHVKNPKKWQAEIERIVSA